jgi:hypothetical protein
VRVRTIGRSVEGYQLAVFDRRLEAATIRTVERTGGEQLLHGTSVLPDQEASWRRRVVAPKY